VPFDDHISVAIPVSPEDFQKRRRQIIAICCFVAIVLSAAGYLVYRHYMDPIRAREAYDDAKRLIAVTRYQQAILACSTAILLKPDYADAYMLRAQAFAAQRELEPAETDFTNLIRLEPQSARGYAGRCEVYYNFKDYQKAIADCGKAVELDPSNARAFNQRGAALRETSDPTASLIDLNRAVELSHDVDNLYQRGATYRALGRFKEAIADFDQAAFLFPGNPEVYRARAEAKRAMGDEKGAEADYTQGKALEGR
jgi:tetratricopeptide (TPR) repeat protein